MLNKNNFIKTEHKYIYKSKIDGTYLVILNVKDNLYNKRSKVTKTGFKTIREANDFIAKERLKYKNNENITNENICFKEAYEEYIKICKLEVKKGIYAESTIRSKETLFKNHILPKLGKVKIKDINEDHIRKFQNDLLSTKNMRNKDKIISNETARKIHKQLSAFFNYCVKRKLITYNPAAIVGNFKKNKKEMPYLTIEEFNKLLSVVDNTRDYFILLLLFSSGLRISEVLGLTIDNIITNYNGKTSLTINKTYYNGKIRFRAKTNESLDNLYLDDITKEIYDEYLKYRERNGIVSNYLFPNTSGIGKSEVLSDSAIRSMLKKYLKQANITKNITPHKLRHSQAALLIYMGEDLEVVKTKLRHKDIRTTSNEYGHMYEDKKIELADKLSKIFYENIEKKVF